ncbi:hypothetical protein COO91_07331 [Nostoc flagelliforme CCNUN1]|uniref:Uncharacterized protein n=1 Tax=Nostoc flagelliforme CCNUN1 TaxID=2038116 RepID=A0A2K8T102_9NOSO|nr:hypothetical protein COO91_07331 [Nostoc flagelliforme CCNUN1]
MIPFFSHFKRPVDTLPVSTGLLKSERGFLIKLVKALLPFLLENSGFQRLAQDPFRQDLGKGKI